MKNSSPQKPDRFRSLVGITGALLSLAVCTPKAKPTSLTGAWSITCEDPDVLEVTTPSTASLTTNQNQIVVETAVLGSASNYELRFSKPGEMGAGGGAVDWKTISTSAPIAVIHLESDTSACILTRYQSFIIMPRT